MRLRLLKRRIALDWTLSRRWREDLGPGQTNRFFARLLSRLFNYSNFRNVYQLKVFTITNICPPNETLLHMLSLDFLDKVAKPVDFHSTIILLPHLFDKTSLDSTRQTQQGGQTAQCFHRFLSSKRSNEKSSRLARVLGAPPQIWQQYSREGRI